MTEHQKPSFTFKPGAAFPLFAFTPPGKTPFVFGSLGGRIVVLSLLSSDAALCAAQVEAFAPWLPQFDIERKAFVGLCGSHAALEAITRWNRDNHVQFFQDPQLAVHKSLGIEAGVHVTVVLDATLRVLRVFNTADAMAHAQQVMEYVARLTPASSPVGRAASTAPVMLLDNVFEPDLIKSLIDYYDKQGGTLSGFMRTMANGQTAETTDYNHKVRRDTLIKDDILRQRCRSAIEIALIPAIQRAFQFQATRMERYLIGCYEPEADGVPGGHFNRHRDNTTRGTVHRRFAVSIGLNADEYDGGDLRFPEFDQRTYRPSTGGALVFSCSLLHEVLPVTRGRRMVFLPFLFDEAAEQIRLQNLHFLASNAA
jgi:peroxiredoxin